MTNTTGIMKRLRTYFDNTCHYCGLKCTTRVGHPRQATKDHIVPRFFGGENTFDNYVLACQQCNSRRGNDLFECDCVICGPRIKAALDNQRCFDHVFKGMSNFNRPRIAKETKGSSKGKWRVNVGTGCRHYDTFDEALHAAMAGPTIRSYND